MDRDREARPPGLILAGGRASRLGGGDKTLRLVASRTILARIVERVGPQCGGLALSANGEPARFAPWSGPVLPDHADDAGRGPLAGLLAGLDWAAAHHPAADTLLTVPADTPFLPRDLVARLDAALRLGRATVAFGRSAGREHPLAALWATAVRPRVRTALREEGVRRVRDLHARLGAVPVDWPAEAVDPFFNVNTPAEFAEAERLARLA